MTIEFTFIGEHLKDPAHLLVLGADGGYYDYDPAHERLAPTEPDDQWLLLPALDDAAEQAPTAEGW